MDGAKSVTDTLDHLKRCMVDRRPARIEASSQGGVDLVGMKILVVVGT